MRAIARVLLALGPGGLVSAFACVLVATLVAVSGGELRLDAAHAAPLLWLAGLTLLTAFWRASWLAGKRAGDRRRFTRALGHALAAWTPFILLYLCYGALHDLTGRLVTGSYEDALKAADEALFGISPSFWFERIANPWLTDLMAFGYGLMFWLPLGVLLVLYLRAHERPFREVALALLFAFYLGFALYLAVPARSPRLVYPYAHELRGALGLYESWTVAWDALQGTAYDAFPSLHTAVSTLALASTRRYGALLVPRHPRLAFALYLPLVVLLQLATLYLRQHYFVDLVAGWLLAAAAFALAPRLERAFARVEARFARALGPAAGVLSAPS